MNYHQIISNLEKRGMMPEGPPELATMKEGLSRLLPDLQIDPSRTIVVAGTNGKGSVCASLEALFLATGESVGLYTSPHLISTTERFRINGEDISQEVFCWAYHQVTQRTEGLNLSHFEILTLIAAWLFYANQEIPRVDRAIFEVGLGGTWDATNVIPHQNCVITTLGFDHENLLGNTLGEIALNKFGIITPGARVVHSPLPSEVKSFAEEVRLATQSTWTESIPFTVKVEDSSFFPKFCFQTLWGEVILPLPGTRAAQNAATALTLFHQLGFDPKAYIHALTNIKWPGRMECIGTSPCPIFLSGDHNPQGIQSLLELLPHYPRKHLFVLVGVCKDKNLEGILTPLLELRDASVFLTETPFRRRPLDSYGHWLDRVSGALSNPSDATKHIASLAQPEDMILVTGSLYLVGLIKEQQLSQSDKTVVF